MQRFSLHSADRLSHSYADSSPASRTEAPKVSCHPASARSASDQHS